MRAEIRDTGPDHPYLPIYVGDRCVALAMGGMGLTDEDVQAIAGAAEARGADDCMSPEEVERFLMSTGRLNG